MLIVQFVGYALLLPFFGWGIYLLRRRFLYYEESSMGLETATVVFVGVVFWIETMVLREALSGQFLHYFAAMLGLSMAGFALYAHVAISMLSRLIVEVVAPGEDSALDHPRFGPVDALERDGDYEAAVVEYLVLARIYPRNPEVLCRTANAHAVLARTDDAVGWYLRARKRAQRADDALEAVNGLVRLYDNELQAPEKADYHLARFIRDFPESPDTAIVRDRLNRRAQKTDWSVSDFLNALEDDPLSDAGNEPSPEALPAVGPPLTPPRQAVELVALESAGAAEATPAQEPEAMLKRSSGKDDALSTLTPLADGPENVAAATDKAPRKRQANGKRRVSTRAPAREGLQALDEGGSITPDEPDQPLRGTRTSSISLEPMDEPPA